MKKNRILGVILLLGLTVAAQSVIFTLKQKGNPKQKIEATVNSDELIAQTLVRPFLMIVVDKRADGRPEVRFAKRYYPRQTLGSDRPDKSLGKRV